MIALWCRRLKRRRLILQMDYRRGNGLHTLLQNLIVGSPDPLPPAIVLIVEVPPQKLRQPNDNFFAGQGILPCVGNKRAGFLCAGVDSTAQLLHYTFSIAYASIRLLCAWLVSGQILSGFTPQALQKATEMTQS